LIFEIVVDQSIPMNLVQWKFHLLVGILLLGWNVLWCTGAPLVQVVQTARDTGDRLTPKNPLQFRPLNGSISGVALHINSTARFQSIIGFGSYCSSQF
jgi:hypothetical protein